MPIFAYQLGALFWAPRPGRAGGRESSGAGRGAGDPMRILQRGIERFFLGVAFRRV